ncbi:hypothetical protein H2200_003891 [Cladophialophora chaetospira]|uniref:Uncharacterized protein n=1 Tax=Cladophialophora chaetospira TaxID=386627 RepID=A0AA38XFU7_9EURO|nr:hypothetical protein H2200_003891 [Cladophialophora chaetospira]
MDKLPIIRPRTPDGPMGYLNYPPEIMNQIYHEILVDDSQIFSFLCSSDPKYRLIGLKQAVAAYQSPRFDRLDWRHLFDARYYTESRGLSAQLLRVCKKIWSEATAVLYGNLTIAMRWDVRQELSYDTFWYDPRQRGMPEYVDGIPPDPCIKRFFKRNAVFVIASAAFVFPKLEGPLYTRIPGGTAYWVDAVHWGMTHQTGQADPREHVLRRLDAMKKRRWTI